MNMPLYFRAGGDEPRYCGAPPAFGSTRPDSSKIASTALWGFMGVATSLFFLFIASYLMRMQSTDWHPIAMPRQLWVSTAFLVGASASMHLANSAARNGRGKDVRKTLLAAGLFMAAFLFAQAWAWQVLLAGRVSIASNPAGSYFYLLTAMHGLHVAGGLIAWLLAFRPFLRRDFNAVPTRSTSTVRLCERYWHFLLAVWLALFATMSGLTNDVVQFVCNAT
jgi:cytochrome c oxidase subunit 3